MSSRSRASRKAFRVMQALASTASARIRATAARQVVPNRALYEEAPIQKDAILSAFRRHLETAVPMPATPEMRVVWQPYRRALERVINERADPARALTDAEREIAGYIKKLRQP
jgi:arabinogalactan oligomer/maltooligosaccharide transport system substrate-binding protein